MFIVWFKKLSKVKTSTCRTYLPVPLQVLTLWGIYLMSMKRKMNILNRYFTEKLLATQNKEATPVAFWMGESLNSLIVLQNKVPDTSHGMEWGTIQRLNQFFQRTFSFFFITMPRLQLKYKVTRHQWGIIPKFN